MEFLQNKTLMVGGGLLMLCLFIIGTYYIYGYYTDASKSKNKYITKKPSINILAEGVLTLYFAFGMYSAFKVGDTGGDFGLFPFQKKIVKSISIVPEKLAESKGITLFFMLTAFYELTQILINNSDIILVKHYFDNEQAGLYASLALIGRVVYFVAWMFVMLLLPKVIQLKKEGKNKKKIFMGKY